ncbi:farnesyl-diphosphate synthase [Metarhizobium album]|uniref:Probable farnesyl diphosphate synthase n=1 Tax=Metarhizobium album TaxID=2182425 RepID=A0A2U2DPI8_9HYPH|nr:farnesyl diphosphate synthase [Rhizobium album]PWE55213.1 farnesyl-diphosphate synthase [Rhizobium album]
MMTQPTAFETRLEDNAAKLVALLEELLSDGPLADEIQRPPRLMAAMRHGVLNGGKRLRPFLVIESAALFSGNPQAALRIGAALECVHCYSLVHDDLPAMDDDDVRRGKPTVHIAFDEATAILAGDSLLTLAFDIVAAPETDLSDRQKTELVLCLARAAGIGGMAGGQMFDLAAEQQAPDEQGIVTLQAMKTGALIRFACEAGAIVAGATADDRARLRLFGEKIGLAFQLADDLLDLTADPETMGKATGKDAARGKGTLPALHGQAWTEAKLTALIAEAANILGVYGDRAEILLETARFIANRRH